MRIGIHTVTIFIYSILIRVNVLVVWLEQMWLGMIFMAKLLPLPTKWNLKGNKERFMLVKQPNKW